MGSFAHTRTEPVGKCRKLIFLLQFYSSAKFNNKLWHFWPLEQATTGSGSQWHAADNATWPEVARASLGRTQAWNLCSRLHKGWVPSWTRLPTPPSLPPLLPSSAVQASCQRHRLLGCGCACGFSYGACIVYLHCTRNVKNTHRCICVKWNYISYAFTVQFVWFALLLLPLGAAHKLLCPKFQ